MAKTKYRLTREESRKRTQNIRSLRGLYANVWNLIRDTADQKSMFLMIDKELISLGAQPESIRKAQFRSIYDNPNFADDAYETLQHKQEQESRELYTEWLKTESCARWRMGWPP